LALKNAKHFPEIIVYYLIIQCLLSKSAVAGRPPAGYAPLMKMRLIIDLASLPEDGKSFVGELAAEVFDLPPGDAQPTGPLVYELWAQRYGSELLLLGSLTATFEFTCVRTLHPFLQTIRVENAAISLEIGNSTELDASDALREEVLIHFPIDPKCEHGDVPQECKIDSQYLAVDKPAESGHETPPRAEGDDRWSALDTLKDLKDQP
jgi:uncharacterized metal-binding protein YceD (DUF177 family)